MTQITINDSLKVSFIVKEKRAYRLCNFLTCLKIIGMVVPLDPSISETMGDGTPEVVFTVNCKDIEEAAFLKQLVKRFV